MTQARHFIQANRERALEAGAKLAAERAKFDTLTQEQQTIITLRERLRESREALIDMMIARTKNSQSRHQALERARSSISVSSIALSITDHYDQLYKP